jgi:hypothetical protein
MKDGSKKGRTQRNKNGRKAERMKGKEKYERKRPLISLRDFR